MIERQPVCRNWCNCNAIISLRRIEKQEAASQGRAHDEERLSNEIAGTMYAHDTGRCRSEYDPSERPIGEVE